MANTALKTFSIENDIVELSPQDDIYKFDPEADRKINRESPWSKESVVQKITTGLDI